MTVGQIQWAMCIVVGISIKAQMNRCTWYFLNIDSYDDLDVHSWMSVNEEDHAESSTFILTASSNALLSNGHKHKLS